MKLNKLLITMKNELVKSLKENDYKVSLYDEIGKQDLLLIRITIDYYNSF